MVVQWKVWGAIQQQELSGSAYRPVDMYDKSGSNLRRLCVDLSSRNNEERNDKSLSYTHMSGEGEIERNSQDVLSIALLHDYLVSLAQVGLSFFVAW